MKKLKVIVALLSVSFLLAACGSAPPPGGPQAVASEAGRDGAETDGEGNVPSIVSSFIKKTHPSPFTKLPEEEFDQEMSALGAEWEALGEEQAYYKLRKLVARLGDSHTMPAPAEEMYLPQLPFFAMIYEDKWIVVQAGNDYMELVGKELTAINGMEISQVKDRLLPLISYETKAWADYQCSLEFRYLHSLTEVGVVNNPQALSVTVRDTVTGEENSLEVKPLAEGYDYQNATMIPLAGTIAQSGNYRGMLLEDGTVFIQYNVCAEAPELSMADFAKAMEEQAFSQTPEKIIVDLRHNGGGNSEVIKPLLKTLEKQQKKGADLYCLIGAETFSSGLMNAIDLKQMGAIVVGESTGGVMGFGELKECALPGGYTLYCSSKDFSGKEWNGTALEPDIEAVQTVEDLLNGRDTAIELIKGR